MTREPFHAHAPARWLTGQLYIGVIVGLVVAVLILATGTGNAVIALGAAAVVHTAALGVVIADRHRLATWSRGRCDTPRKSMVTVGFTIGLLPVWIVLFLVAVGH